MQLYQETPDYKDIQVLTKDYGFIDYVFFISLFLKMSSIILRNSPFLNSLVYNKSYYLKIYLFF